MVIRIVCLSIAAAVGFGAVPAGAAELVLHHPDFHARLGMKVCVEVGEAAPGVSLSAVLSSAGSFRKTVAQVPGPLRPEEAITLDLRPLPSAEYTLTVRLSDGRQAVRTWRKPYDGIPRVGIDENNAVCVEGRPFFPVTPWGVGGSEESLETWGDFINTLNGYTFSDDEATIEGWKKALDRAGEHGIMVIGPAYGHYWPNGSGRRFYSRDDERLKDREANLDAIADYVRQTRDHPALLMWSWLDEPELDTPSNCVTPAEVRRWTEKCHELDPQHPVYLNTGGSGFVRPDGSWLYNHIRTYTYVFGTADPSRKVLVADVLSQDYYPISNKGSSRGGTPITIENMCLAMDRMGAWNGGLTPLMAFVETCAIRGSATSPTPAELRLLCWANIIHGARGISWFHYFSPTPEENFREMARFKEQVTRLARAVLGADYGGSVACSTSGKGRVDVMVKQAEAAVWVFAANVRSEPATLTVELDRAIRSVQVVDEDRSIAPAGKAFADEFEPLAVHIYRLGM